MNPPVPPIPYSKTLFCQLDPDRHMRAKLSPLDF
jgi:hypothetical protein